MSQASVNYPGARLAASLGYISLDPFTRIFPSDVTGCTGSARRNRIQFKPTYYESGCWQMSQPGDARTQSALLEGYQERQVTIDGVIHPLRSPFLVDGHAKPIELEGTFPRQKRRLICSILHIDWVSG
jgi:hypothetical protein